MKVLWFVQKNFDPSKEKNGYNGAGWISSLRDQLIKHDNIELALAFFSNDAQSGFACGVKYFSMPTPKLPLVQKIILRCRRDLIKEEMALWPLYKKEMLKVVNDYNPDIIQIFGTENKYGLLATTDLSIPILIHLQGMVNPIFNAYLPPFVSWHNYLGFTPFFKKNTKDIWKSLCFSEKVILSHAKYVLGRTDWDKKVSKIYSPQCSYYYCSEILRSEFYETCLKRQMPKQLCLVSIISSPLYKGYDLILKTAQLLCQQLKLDFVWKVFGNVEYTSTEKRLLIKHQDVHVKLCGVKNAHEIKDELLHSTIYVHPSYIDNSPNSVCEAQFLGCTCISTNVGGVSSIVEDGKTGFLVPSNDPYKLASLIDSLYHDEKLNIQIGDNSKKIASIRHDRENITNSLINIYSNILENKNKI